MRFASGRALRRSRSESRASNASGAARTQAGEAVRAQSRHATRLRSVRHHHLRVRAARRHVDAQLDEVGNEVADIADDDVVVSSTACARRRVARVMCEPSRDQLSSRVRGKPAERSCLDIAGYSLLLPLATAGNVENTWRGQERVF